MMQIHYQIRTLDLLLQCSKQAEKLLVKQGFDSLIINDLGSRKIAHYVRETFDKKGIKHFLYGQEHYPKILRQRELAIVAGYLFEQHST